MLYLLLGWLNGYFFCGFVETGFYKRDPLRGPGDFKNGGILGVPNASGPITDAEERKRKLNSELANGRLAMMAIIGLFFQDGLTGSAWGDWASYTASPLRATQSSGGMHAKRGMFKGRAAQLAVCAESVSITEASPSGLQAVEFDMTKQFGVTAPTGRPGEKIWDPAGLARNIDATTFQQYRAAELKHGRICMLALLGLIAQHSWKLPKFQEMPSGIAAAASNLPSAAALGLIFMICGIIEFNSSDDGREPGDYGDPFEIIDLAGFNPEQPDELALWKNRELNHCRLAMVGFFGAVMAEYATGLDAVEQWGSAKAAWNRTTVILSFPEGDVPPLNSFIGNM